jgi:hypothetical protein
MPAALSQPPHQVRQFENSSMRLTAGCDENNGFANSGDISSTKNNSCARKPTP